MGKKISSAGLQWLLRRIPDWGGWLGGIFISAVTLYNALPPEAQTAITAVLSGRWQDITLGSLVPIAALVWSQVISYRATVKSQVVVDGRQVLPSELPPQTVVYVEEAARTAIARQPRSVLDRLLEQLNKPER